MRRMRKALLILGVLVGLVVVLLLAAVFLIDVNRYHGIIQAQLEQQLGRKVTLGTMSLGFLPLRLQVQNPVIAEDAAFGTERPFVRADKLDVSVSPMSLLRGNVNVQALELERPNLELIRNKRGIWNVSTLGSTAPANNTAGNPSAGRGLSVDRLSIRDGQVAVTDLENPKARTIYDHIDLTTKVTDQAGVLATTGDLKLNAARFNGVDIGYPIAVDYDVVSKSSEGLLTINSAKLQLGQTPVDLAGSITTNTIPPRLNLAMKTGDVQIGEIARLASAFGIAFPPGTTVAGKINANVKAAGSTESPALNGNIAIRDLKASSKEVPTPLEVKAVDLALSPSEIRSNDFTATSGKTNVAARFAVRQYASPSPSIDLTARAPGATLPEIQSIARAYGMKGLDQMKGDGKLDLDVHASGPVHSLNSDNLIRALNGTMNLDFNALRIAGFDAAHELSVIGGFADNKSAAQAFTDVLKLTGHVNVKDGIAQTDDLKAEMSMGNLAATGTTDLVGEAMNLKLSAILSKAYTEKVGGTRVGGYMRTALANNNGELVIPAIISGSYKNPKFQPDLQAIVQLQKQKLIPGYEPGQKPADTIKGILGILGGKKQ
jgi:uncharacterized protein involved in outer membrane biogenesis